MNQKSLTVSAPGKLMLFGEHAVVYGFPCITTAIDQRLFVTIEETNDGKITIDAPEGKDTRFVDTAIQIAVDEWGIVHDGFRLATKSPFSGKYGFGSSSAVTVTTLKALASLYKKDIDDRGIFDMAYRVVLSVQGAASGFDVASATYGGTIYYIKGGKIIEPLSVSDMEMVIGYTGAKGNTVDLINAVSQKKKEYPQKVDRIFVAIGSLVDQAKAKMLEGDWQRVGTLMNFNQEYLRDLGVSSEKLEALISVAKGAGAWGAKLSGAGGGDCMIAMVSPDKRKAVEDAIEKAGGEVMYVALHAAGVRVEETV